jgi:hypothetical protein
MQKRLGMNKFHSIYLQAGRADHIKLICHMWEKDNVYKQNNSTREAEMLRRESVRCGNHNESTKHHIK